MDSFFGMGKNMFELVPGYDCPAYADYLDSEWHQAYKTHNMPNSICIFEYTADHLLSRHTAQYSVTASRNTFLTIRSVSTVGNYGISFSLSNSSTSTPAALSPFVAPMSSRCFTPACPAAPLPQHRRR